MAYRFSKSNLGSIVFGLFIGVGFLFIIYRFLPLGLALVITGGALGTLANVRGDKFALYLGTFGAWLYPIGVVVTFVQNGWKFGLLSIVLGFIAYKLAQDRK